MSQVQPGYIHTPGSNESSPVAPTTAQRVRNAASSWWGWATGQTPAQQLNFDATSVAASPATPVPSEPPQEAMLRSYFKEPGDYEPPPQELVAPNPQATPVQPSDNAEPIGENGLIDFFNFAVARVRPEGASERLEEFCVETTKRLRQLYEKGCALVPEEWRSPSPPVSPPASPPASPRKSQPAPRRRRIQPSVPTERAAWFSQLARGLLVRPGTKLSQNEELFFNELGVRIERQGAGLLTPYTTDLSLPPEVSLGAIVNDPVVRDRLLGRLKQIIDRVDQRKFRDLRILLAKRLAGHFEGVAQAIAEGDPVPQRYLCDALDNEVEYFENLFRHLLRDFPLNDATDQVLDGLIPHFGARIIVQIVDLLCEDEMIESYFVQFLTTMTSESDGADGAGAIQFDREEMQAWLDLVGGFTAGPADLKVAANLFNLDPIKKAIESQISTLAQVFLIQEDGALRFDLGIAAAALLEQNQTNREVVPPARFDDLVEIFNQKVLYPLTGEFVAKSFKLHLIVPRMRRLCRENKREFLRNLILSIIRDSLSICL